MTTRLDTIDFLNRPRDWPRRPVLPLVRRDGRYPQIAIAIDGPTGLILYEGVNMFDALDDLPVGEILAADQIAARGWEVD